MPVFDRYTVVLHIFRCNARTKEAKLQVALAEIPLLRYLGCAHQIFISTWFSDYFFTVTKASNIYCKEKIHRVFS